MELDLSDCLLGVYGLNVFAVIVSFQKIRKLNLSNNNLSFHTCGYGIVPWICHIIECCTTLIYFTINKNEFNDDFAFMFNQCLNDRPITISNLQVFSVLQNQFTAKGITQLQQSQKKLKTTKINC